MNYEIIFQKQPLKFIRKLETKVHKRVVSKIDALAINPTPIDSTSIKGQIRMFRIRSGKIRIIYEVDFENKTIYITKIDYRKKVYLDFLFQLI